MLEEWDGFLRGDGRVSFCSIESIAPSTRAPAVAPAAQAARHEHFGRAAPTCQRSGAKPSPSRSSLRLNALPDEAHAPDASAASSIATSMPAERQARAGADNRVWRENAALALASREQGEARGRGVTSNRSWVGARPRRLRPS